MPVPAAALRPLSWPRADQVFAFFVFVIVGPPVGLLTFAAMSGSFSPLVGLGAAYIFGIGPAATCAILCLLLERRLGRPLWRFLAAPVVGAVSGIVGMIPAFLLFVGGPVQTRDLSMTAMFFALSIGFSIVAALSCTAIVEAVRLVRRNKSAPA